MEKQHRIKARVRTAMFFATVLSTVAVNPSAGGQAKQNSYRVNAQMMSNMDIPPAVLKEGQDSASVIFAAIHVQLVWASQLQTFSQVSPCVGEAAAPNLTLQIVPRAPGDVSNVALAMAMPYANSGVRIVVFYDRVDPLLSGHRAPAGKVLGYVLAHEIAHVLQGISRHSETGIMRARWSENDFRQMAIAVLTFTKEDAQLIRRRLAALAGLPGPC